MQLVALQLLSHLENADITALAVKHVNFIYCLFYFVLKIFFLQLKSFDKELEAFENTLTEFPVMFPPSYPFEEKISQATNYMQTRCPGWCDRVLLSLTAKELISDEENVEYSLMGTHTCMGDHKV